MVSARFGPVIVALCLTFASSALAGVALADEAADEAAKSARDLFERGVESVKQESWTEAAAYFERSASFVPRQSTLYNLALCRHHLGDYAAALQAIDRLYSSGDPPDTTTREHAQKLRERALERVVVLDITVEPPEATITVDGMALPSAPGAAKKLYLPPGPHDVSVTALGRVPVRFSMEGKAGHSLARSVALAVAPDVMAPSPAPAPALPPNAVPVPSANSGVAAHWVLLGTGALLLAGAAVTGAVAWKADSDFVDACPSLLQCNPNDVDLKDRAASFARASDVLLGLGAATTGVGALLLWRAESSSGPVRAFGLSLHGTL